MKKKILLGTISNTGRNWLPYSVSCLIAYAQQFDSVNEKYDFLVPEWRHDCLNDPEFIDQLANVDILGLTNFMWNQHYNDAIMLKYKELNPNGIGIYGGTNVPQSEELAESYKNRRPYVDVFFGGSAEHTFKEFLENLDDQGIYGHVGTYTHNTFDYLRKSDEHTKVDIPDPYTSGVIDGVLNKFSNIKFAAILETDRGCPYHCSFCDWGGKSKSKLKRGNTDVVNNIIDSVFSNTQINCVALANANFGMLPEDLTYIKRIANITNQRDDSDSFAFMPAGFAKNGGDIANKVMEIAIENFNYAGYGKIARYGLQSTNTDVLKANLRSNMDSKKIIASSSSLASKGYTLGADLIVGMPGDSLHRFLGSLENCVYSLHIKVFRMSMLMVLPNTPMKDPEYMKEHGMITKKLLVPAELENLKVSEILKDPNRITTCDFSNTSDFIEMEVLHTCNTFDPVELTEMFVAMMWINLLYSSGAATYEMINSPLTLSEQFFKLRAEMAQGNTPVLKKIFDNYIELAWLIAKPEPETKITTAIETHFIAKDFQRGFELIELYKNKDAVFEELKLIYPNITSDHIVAKTDSDSEFYLKLMRSGAKII